MQTLTDKEFKDKYGVIAASTFDASKKKEGVFDSIKNDIQKRGEENVNILSKSSSGFGEDVSKGFQVAGNTAGAVGDVVGEGIKAIPGVGGIVNAVGGAIGKGFNAVTDKLGGTKFFQEAAEGLPEGNTLEKGLKIGAGAGEVAGNILGADIGVGAAKGAIKTAGKAGSKVGETVSTMAEKAGPATQYVKGAIRDVVPTTQMRIDENIAKGLDLTATDLKNIEQSTGNPVGTFMAEHNLIGSNRATTEGLIKGFFQTNYKAVRDEIGKVTKTYKPTEIPRYTDALKQLQQTVDGIPGMEKEAAQVDNMLNLGRPIILNDVQAVKEMLDKHYNLFNNAGDVAQNITKQGLANVRGELKTFIENEVKQNTGADIRAMNNNVMTSKGLVDAIEARSTRGITRSHFSQRDLMIGLGLSYFGSPIVGVGYVFLKKLAESSTARLRFARWLDQLSDAKKANVAKQLNAGEVPAEAEAAIGNQSSK